MGTKIAVLCVICCLAMSGCSRREENPPAPASGSEPPSPASSQSAPAPFAAEDALFRELGLLGAPSSLEPWSSSDILSAAQALGEAGYVVQMFHRPTANHEKAEAFFQAEADGVLDIYSLSETGFSGRRYLRRDGWEMAWLDVTADGVRLAGDPEPVELRLTDKGNLIVKLGEDQYTGYRITPLPAESYAAYWRYVAPVDGLVAFWRDPWEAPDYGDLNFDFIFERLWEHENRAVLSQSEYFDAEKDAAVLPAEAVEGLLTRYFDIAPEALRRRATGKEQVSLYRPEEDAYHIEGWRGGGYWGVTEVWSIEDNGDGTLTLSVGVASLEFNDEGRPAARLTVMPREDGSFLYLRHEPIPEEPAAQVPEKYNSNDRYAVLQPKDNPITIYLYDAATGEYHTQSMALPDYMLTVHDILAPVEEAFGPLYIDRIVYDEAQNKLCVNITADSALATAGLSMERADEILFSIGRTLLENYQLPLDGVYFEQEMEPIYEPEIP